MNLGNVTKLHYGSIVFFTAVLTKSEEKESFLSHKDALTKAVNKINIKSWPLTAPLCNILRDKWVVHVKHLGSLNARAASRKSICVTV